MRKNRQCDWRAETETRKDSSKAGDDDDYHYNKDLTAVTDEENKGQTVTKMPMTAATMMKVAQASAGCTAWRCYLLEETSYWKGPAR